MSDDAWLQLLEDFVGRRIGVNEFHDRFFDLWNGQPRFGPFCPPPIEELFYTVEAYCPDPSLRDPHSPYEASEAEVYKNADNTLARLKAGRR